MDEITERANPSVKPDSALLFQVSASALSERASSSGESSKNPDSSSEPTSHRASKCPSSVFKGRDVRKKACGNPAALSLITIGFLNAGPHHSFSVAAPTSSGPAVTVSDDCPG